ncbi:MAG: hypothetical protein Q8P18_24910 [Pseudomonadota bacterium]|nr:hypothetical protein [Pseudomonadota bacterium]
MVLVYWLAACVGGDDTSTDDDTSAGEDTGVLPGPDGPSRVQSDCAPDDGPAVRLIVGLDEATCDSAFDGVPHVRINLWVGAELPLEPGTYPFESGSGSAWYSPSGAGVEQYGTSGEVVVTSSTGGVVTGTYRVELDSGAIVGGAFTADVCPDPAMCG